MSEVMKKETTSIRINVIMLNKTFRAKTSGNSFSFFLSLENSLIIMLGKPKLEKITNKETNAKAKVNFPYSVTPKIRAI